MKRKRARARRLSPLGVQLLSTPRGHRLLVEALRRRMGETPDQRLRWIVEFTRGELDALTPGELEAKGDDLRMIAAYSLPRGVFLKTKTAPVPMGVMKNYQDRIDQGLRDALSKDGRWELSGRPVLENRGEAGFRIVVEGDEMTGILSAVAQLVVEVGDRLRACADPKCGRPFVAVKRQSYCNTQHSQRERNRKRMEKERIG